MNRKITQPRTWTIAILVTLVVAVWFVLPQLSVVVFTSLMAFVFYPLYTRLKKKKGGIAAVLTLLISFFVVLLPLTFIAMATLSQLASFAEVASQSNYWEKMPEFASRIIEVANTVLAPITGQYPSITDGNISDFLRTTIPNLARSIVNIVLGILANLPQLAIMLIIYIFLFVEFLRYGPQIISTLKTLSPFDKKVTDHYLERVGLMAKAMVTGQLIIAMILAVIAATLLALLGFGHYFFIFFVIFTILNFMPLGSGLILIPLALYTMFTGQFWLSIVVILLYALSGNLDPILRSKLIPDKIQLSIGLTMLSTFCGIAYFGILGVVYGPIIMILIITTIEFYQNAKAAENQQPKQQKT
ncbi:MAG TPA: AI-2E family transporter [Candidatus Saccharibacteria bacterium]|nr:AI-2E family transporter [Candidatus Saccharibacteria bacterium]